jgi:hypothetical protein
MSVACDCNGGYQFPPTFRKNLLSKPSRWKSDRSIDISRLVVTVKTILLSNKRNVRRNISIQNYLSCFINHPSSFDMLQRTKTSRRNCAPTPLEIPICGPFDVWWHLIWTHTILWRGMENTKSNFLFCNRGYLRLSHSCSVSNHYILYSSIPLSIFSIEFWGIPLF